MAAVDFFLKIDGIAGESTDSKHPGEIELESWSWGETNSGSASSATGGGGSGKVSMQDFHFTMKTNSASPKLFLNCANGKHIPNAILTNRKAGGTALEYYVIKFTDLLISSYQTGGGGGLLPVDQISFNFGKIELTYTPQKSDGSPGSKIPAGWNQVTNQAV
jgi:type VI secretion system secreted protein Hcp